METISTFPATSIDLDVYKNSLHTNKKGEGAYGGVPFGISTYSVQTGRFVDITDFTNTIPVKVKGRKSTTGTGGSAIEVALANVAKDPVLQEKIKELSEKSARENKNKTVDGSTGLTSPGVNPIPKDLSALPHKITMRIFFMDTFDLADYEPTAITDIAGLLAKRTGTVTKLSGTRVRKSYTHWRDEFVKVTSDPNPKLLQLPTYGVFLAIPGIVKMEYNKDSGGIEYADVEFYRATSDIIVPSDEGTVSIVQSGYKLLQERTASIIEKTQTDILSRSENQNGGIPTDVANRMSLSVTERVALLQEGSGSLASSIVSDIEGKLQTIDKFTREVVAISNQINTLILAPAKLADHIGNTYKTLMGAITAPIEAYEYMSAKLDIFLGEMEDVTLDTLDTLGLYELTNNANHASNCFSAVAEATIDTEFDSVEQILDSRDGITTRYKSLISILSRFPEFELMMSSINTLYGNSISYLIDKQANLPNLRTISVQENTPLITIAYRLYGDSDFKEELKQRNNVNSCLFPPTELEVLAI